MTETTPEAWLLILSVFFSLCCGYPAMYGVRRRRPDLARRIHAEAYNPMAADTQRRFLRAMYSWLLPALRDERSLFWAVAGAIAGQLGALVAVGLMAAGQ